MQTSSTVTRIDVYAKTQNALQAAKTLLLKVRPSRSETHYLEHRYNKCFALWTHFLLLQEQLVTARGVPTPAPVQVHFPPDAQSQSAFDAQAFLARLATQNLGSTIMTTAELPSTQTLLHDNASMIPDGTVCVADRQVMGKGDLAQMPTRLTLGYSLVLLQSPAQWYWQYGLIVRYDHIASY